MNTRMLLAGLAAAALLAGPALAAPPASTPAKPATAASTATPAKVTPVKATSKAERRATEIRAAQEKLKGMNLYSGPIDGKRNATYVKSLESFQRDHKLTANGHLNSVTEKALGI